MLQNVVCWQGEEEQNSCLIDSFGRLVRFLLSESVSFWDLLGHVPHTMLRLGECFSRQQSFGCFEAKLWHVEIIFHLLKMYAEWFGHKCCRPELFLGFQQNCSFLILSSTGLGSPSKKTNEAYDNRICKNDLLSFDQCFQRDSSFYSFTSTSPSLGCTHACFRAWAEALSEPTFQFYSKTNQ